MAIVPYGYYQETAAVREDLIPDITIVSPEDTPFNARCEKVKASQKQHEWLTDTLEARSLCTPSVEGVAYASGARAARVRLSNFCEIQIKAWTVSGSIEAMDVVTQGRGEFRYQGNLRRQELANSIENRTITTTAAVSGASGTASQLKGLEGWVTTNVSSSTNTAADRTLANSHLTNALQSCWTAGGRPDVILCPGARKGNLINVNSTSYGSRNVMGGEGKLELRVDVFMGEFGGVQEVVLSRDVTSTSIYILEMKHWKLAYLRRPHVQNMGRDGDRRSAQWVAEYTLESRAESSAAVIKDISG